jgi:hypothetical protein
MPEGTRREYLTKSKAISSVIPTSDRASYSGFNTPYLYFKHFSMYRILEKIKKKILFHDTDVLPVKHTALK